MNASLGEVVVNIRARFDKLERDLAAARARVQGATQKMARAGDKMAAVGKTMTRRVTLPILAAGGAAAKMALDFDDSMTKIKSLVGASDKQMSLYRDKVLSLGRDLPQSPKELADAMFFVVSAGFEGAEALDVLEASAKASAAGLGETKVVADAVTSAVNAYGIENLSASKATDILTAAVREGKLEADALAPAIGRAIPLAAAMGVEFDEVAAAMAGMSRTGTDASTAATQMRAILTSLVKPAAQSKAAMKEFGTSADEVRRSLREKGLLKTLQDLIKRTGGSEEALAKLFPNVRALSGVLDLLGGNASANVKIFDELANATGATDKAFKETAKSVGFKMRAALSSLQVLAIKLGDIILPKLAAGLEKVAGVADWFNDLPTPIKETIVQVGGLVAAVGPLLFIFGKLIKLTAGLTKKLGAMKAAWVAGKGAGIAYTAVIAAGAVAMTNLAKTSQDAKEKTKGFLSELTSAKAVHEHRDQLLELENRYASVTGTFTDFWGAVRHGQAGAAQMLNEYNAEINRVKKSLHGATGASLKIGLAQVKVAEAARDAAERTRWFGKESEVARAAGERLARAEEDLRVAMLDQGLAAQEVAYQEAELSEVRKDLIGVTDDVTTAELDLRDAQRRLKDAQKALNEITEDGTKSGRKYKEAQDAVKRAEINVREAKVRHGEATKELEKHVKAATTAGTANKKAFSKLAEEYGLTSKQTRGLIRDTKGGTQKINAFRESGKLTEDQAKTLHLALEALRRKIKSLPKKRHVRVTADTAQAVGALRHVLSLFNQINDQAAAMPLPGPMPARAAGGDLRQGQVSLVGEKGPEIFVPHVTGTVIPNHKLGDLGSSKETTKTQNIYQVDRVVIPASDIKEMQDVTEFFKKLEQTARQVG